MMFSFSIWGELYIIGNEKYVFSEKSTMIRNKIKCRKVLRFIIAKLVDF